MLEGVFLINFQIGRNVTSLCVVLRKNNSFNDTSRMCVLIM